MVMTYAQGGHRENLLAFSLFLKESAAARLQPYSWKRCQEGERPAALARGSAPCTRESRPLPAWTAIDTDIEMAVSTAVYTAVWMAVYTIVQDSRRGRGDERE